MLTQTELEEASAHAVTYRTHPIAIAVQEYAQELFASESTPGFFEVRRQTGQVLEYALFWEGLRAVLDL